MLFAALFLLAATDLSPASDTLTTLKTELARAMTLKLEDFPPPYFGVFAIDDAVGADIEARFGAVVQDKLEPERQLYVDLRVGDYKFDNTAGKAEPMEISFDETYQPGHLSPVSFDARGLRAALWLIADGQYKTATAGFFRKKGQRIFQADDADKVPSFSHESALSANEPAQALTWDRAGKAELAAHLSRLFTEAPHVFDHDVHVLASGHTRYVVNSEGTQVAWGRRVYGVTLTAYARAPDGTLLQSERSFYAANEASLPSEAKLTGDVKQMIADLAALQKAKPAEPYTGPAILEPEAAGVLFHEALGHRLEGERQKETDDGETFKGKIGQQVIPDFIDVWDDPSLQKFGSDAQHQTELNGFYKFDDEGVLAQKVQLVERGVLRNFLLSRTPVEGFAHSNGHGRSEGILKPEARMGTTMAVARKSVTTAKLKLLLIAEAKRQGKPYGLILRDITGGQTSTETGGYQAFKGSPHMVYQVDVKTGAETLVRSVDLVGTPLSALSRILAADDKPAAFNGYCGSTSGFVPVSTIAPSLLLSEIELQRSNKEKQRAPILPKP